MSETPIGKRLSFFCGGGVRADIPTPITKGALGYGAECKLSVFDQYEQGYTFGASYLNQAAEALVTGPEGAATISRETLSGSFGMIERNLSNSSFDRDDILTSYQVKMTTRSFGRSFIGPGGSSFLVGGTSIDEASGASGGSWTVGKTTTLLGREWLLGERSAVRLSLGFAINSSYENQGSENNQIAVGIPLNLEFGYADAVTKLKPKGDVELSSPEFAWHIASSLHALLNREFITAILAGPSDIVNSSIVGGGGSSGRGELIPLVQAGAMMGGVNKEELFAFLFSGKNRNLVFPTFEGVSTAIALANNQQGPGIGNAMGNVLTAAEMGVYALLDIETPAKRSKLTNEVLDQKAETASLIRYGLGSAFFLVGSALAAANKNTSDPSPVPVGLLSSGIQGTLGVAFFAAEPDPLRRGLVERTDIMASPATFQVSDRGSSTLWSLSGSIHLQDSPLFLRTDLVTPVPGFARGAPDDPYAEKSQPTKVGTAFGIEAGNAYVQAQAAVTSALLLGDSDKSAAIGASVDAAVRIPFSKSTVGGGILIGVRGFAELLLPEGYAYGVAPYIGATF
ncbi:MAG: hypothetical protein HY540_03535 [Deltaproteobacteria bacterium]|nr:hypothetical protein [Deltaproteobacteria bacterium]